MSQAMGCECGKITNSITGLPDEQPLVSKNNASQQQYNSTDASSNQVLSDDDYSGRPGSLLNNPYNNMRPDKVASKSGAEKKGHHKDERTKYRSFLIVEHREYGYMLLKAYKAKKGEHFQLPGGHIDKSELHSKGLQLASKEAGMRELFEETGLNFFESDAAKSRLQRLDLGIENRMYFYLLVDNNDSLHLHPKYQNLITDELKNGKESDDNNNSNTNNRDANDDGKEESLRKDLENRIEQLLRMRGLSKSTEGGDYDFYLKLSHEHTGFTFVRDVETAMDMVQLHSGGHNSIALKKFAKMHLKQKIGKKDKAKRKDSNSKSKSKSKKKKHKGGNKD